MSETPPTPPSDGPPGGDPPPPPPPPPDAGGATTAGAYGSLGKRFGARILDGLIVGIPMFIIVAILPGISTDGFVGQLLVSIAYLAYFVYYEGTSGQTLGKGILDMKVVPEDGSLSYEKAFMRNWWGALGLLSPIPVIGVLVGLASLAIIIYIAITISGDERNQGWHDKLAGTLVVETA